MNASSTDIRIIFSAGYEAGVPDGGTVPTERLVEYTFDPLSDWSNGEATLVVRDLPPLLVLLRYAAHRSSVSLYVGRSGRELCYLADFAPLTNSFLRVYLSADTSLNINFMHPPTDTRTA